LLEKTMPREVAADITSRHEQGPIKFTFKIGPRNITDDVKGGLPALPPPPPKLAETPVNMPTAENGIAMLPQEPRTEAGPRRAAPGPAVGIYAMSGPPSDFHADGNQGERLTTNTKWIYGRYHAGGV
jgi:hypothetical protein